MTLLLCAAVPLLGAAIVALAGRRLGPRSRGGITAASAALSFAAALAVAQAIVAGRASLVAEIGPWLPIRGGDLVLSVNGATLPLLLIFTGGSALIAVASWRTAATPSDQVAILIGASAAVLLVTGASLVLATGAFGALSAATYLALSHGRERAAVAAAAERTLVVDRLADAAMLLATLAFLALVRSFDIAEVETRVASARARSDLALVLPSLLLAASALAKSAQAPFHFRAASLRDAPPVLTAFVAAVPLAGGALLLLRASALVHPTVLAAAAAVGALTAMASLVVAVTRSDAREAVAWLAPAAPGVAIAAIAAGSGAIAIAMLGLGFVGAVALALAASFGRAAPRWRARVDPRARRAIADGLGLGALPGLTARAYGAAATMLERGTDATLDGALVWIANAAQRASRALARGESRSWRAEAVTLAALLAIVAFWIAR